MSSGGAALSHEHASSPHLLAIRFTRKLRTGGAARACFPTATARAPGAGFPGACAAARATLAPAPRGPARAAPALPRRRMTSATCDPPVLTGACDGTGSARRAAPPRRPRARRRPGPGRARDPPLPALPSADDLESLPHPTNPKATKTNANAITLEVFILRGGSSNAGATYPAPRSPGIVRESGLFISDF